MKALTKILLCLILMQLTGIPVCFNPVLMAPARAASRMTSDQLLAFAYRNRRSGFVIEGRGTVVKVLPDDLKGGKHQRFLLQLASGQTLLIAHNIDIAPRVPGLTAGMTVAFKGQYEWNAKGGVIHWTHHDPRGRHTPGWLRVGQRIYQ